MAPFDIHYKIQSLETFPPEDGEDVRSASVLFRHECYYLLGQIGAVLSPEANWRGQLRHSNRQDPGLPGASAVRVLEDESEDEVTPPSVFSY
jgi:hypothetical protein